MTSLLDNTDYCLFCGSRKTWNANFRVTDNDDRLIFKCTICRDCRRKYSIEQIFQRYDTLANAEIAKMKQK
ncbi:MAG: hypothetical protein HeimC3_38940 [Candidatus Heimdallarchaeota archaeon LC_3]|nr:MAG: hypothetical protein HeimC3_38940 [Candidatus Heimdallarchaeota archaeon LC_3]